MWMLIGQSLIIIGLGLLVFGVNIELDSRLKIHKDNKVELMASIYKDETGKEIKVFVPIIKDKNDNSKLTIRTTYPYTIKKEELPCPR